MNRLLVITALCAGLALHCPAHAQLHWHSGEATLFTGVIVRGELCYQPETNALLVRWDDRMQVYTANQLQRFHFIETDSFIQHYFGIYTVSQNGRNDEIPIIFEELTPTIATPLLQLTGNQATRLGRKYGLPCSHSPQWQTPQPWYVWLDGRFIAPDVFVETELDALLATSPEAVQRWGASYLKPANPQALGGWLARYCSRMRMAQPDRATKLITRARVY